jgi:hypothetical protein
MCKGTNICIHMRRKQRCDICKTNKTSNKSKRSNSDPVIRIKSTKRTRCEPKNEIFTKPKIVHTNPEIYTFEEPKRCFGDPTNASIIAHPETMEYESKKVYEELLFIALKKNIEKS